MDRRITIGLLLAIIVAHIVVAATFAVETPYRTAGILLGQRGPDGRPDQVKDIGAPDERQHVNYISHLADGNGFPVFNPKDPNLYETYQSHQPPAFYLLAAGWSKLTGVSDWTENDSGIKLRSLNVVIGSITIAGVFFLLLWGFGESVALVGSAFAALLPMNTALSGAVSNDPLLICLCTWTLALLTLAAKQGWTWKLAIGIGALTGLALLTKTTALALVPVILVTLVLKEAIKPSPAMLGASAAIAILLVAPWWVRNQELYHDPLALQAFSQAFKGSAQKEMIVGSIKATEPDSNAEITYWKDWVGWWTARSFFGTFGYMDIWLNEKGTSYTGPTAPNTLYRLLLAATFLSFIGWLASLKAPDANERTLAHTLNAVFFATIFVLFLRFNAQYFQAQARYLLPALGPVAGAFGVGICQLLKNRTYVALGIVLLLLGGVDVYALTRLPAEFEKRTNPMGLARLEPGRWTRQG